MRHFLTLGLVGIALGAAVAGCEEAEKPKAHHPVSHGDPSMARTLIGQADDATKAGDFDKARKLLKQAEGYADVPTRAEIDAQQDATNEAEADALSEDVKAQAKEGRCKKALTSAHELLGKSEGVAKFVPIKVSKAIAKCLKELTAEEETLTKARTLLDAENTAKVLTPKALKALRDEVVAAVEQYLDKELGPLLAKRDFVAAAAKLAELTKSGLIHDDEREARMDKVREEIAKAVGEIVEKAASAKKGGEEELARIDALLTAGWPDAKSRPENLDKKRVELAFALACRTLRCKTDAIKKRWTYGHTPARPVGDPKATAGGVELKSGTAVWELATGGGYALVATSDPGTVDGTARAVPAVGWVAGKDLRDGDTSEMLPPGESLVGTRVWGPLREGEKQLELGTVVSAKGPTVKVRRLADRVEIEIVRARLHFAVTKQGTKVMGFCNKPDALEPALIDSLKDVHSELMDPTVTLSCLDQDGKVLGVLKEGQLGSLRMPPAWIPAGK